MRPYKHPSVDEVTLERIFHALSDPARLGIVRHLARVGNATCGELDGGRPKSSMSHHFRILREAGLIRTQTEGTVHQNRLRRAELDDRFPGLLSAVLAQPVEPLSGQEPAPEPRPHEARPESRTGRKKGP